MMFLLRLGSLENTVEDIIELYMDADNRIFTMEHLEPAFRLLVLGSCLSGLAFIGELTFFYRRNIICFLRSTFRYIKVR